MTATDKYGRECRPWNGVHVPTYKCDRCEHRGRGCRKYEAKDRGRAVTQVTMVTSGVRNVGCGCTPKRMTPTQ